MASLLNMKANKVNKINIGNYVNKAIKLNKTKV